MRRRVSNIISVLKKEYPGAKSSLKYNNPLNLLVATILSAQCTDRMVNKVTPHLFKKYRRPGDYARVNIRSLQKEIRSIGLYRGKARNIIKMGKMVEAEFNNRIPDSLDELVRLPGVGRKTANVVLSNAFGKSEGIAVDTHVKRISGRLGLTKKKEPGKIELDLMRIIPKRYWGTFNHLLVTHGRVVCRAVNPIHNKCVIRKYCKWYKDNKEAR
ncbi:MAG: endonuclease III [Candidatus Omnitrophica bacterium]|nr:endonuclease III [Candidatus Omnitrophota bacterium]